MQDRLKEIEGTLARTSERKNTILYKLAKRRNEEERLAKLGIRQLPSNPFEVKDPQVVKYALFKLKQEIGDKAAKLRNGTISIEKDGEAIVRAKNDEINKLLVQKNNWEKQLHVIKGDELPRGAPHKKKFFGCAKDLSEAATFREKRDRESSGEEESSDIDDEENMTEEAETQNSPVPIIDGSYASSIASLLMSDAESQLREAEKAAEIACSNSVNKDEYALLTNSDYEYNISIQPEEFFEKELIEKRKKHLKSKLDALRKRD